MSNPAKAPKRRPPPSSYATVNDLGANGGYLSGDFKPIEVYPGEIKFFRELADSCGDSCADFAGGASRIAIPLAEAGVRVTVVDSSEAMLALGRRAAQEASYMAMKNICQIQGDIRRIELQEKVPFIFIAFRSFWPFRLGFQCATERSLLYRWQRLQFYRHFQACCILRSIVRSLTPKGTFAIDAPFGDADALLYARERRESWWKAMAARFNFSFIVRTPYTCRVCISLGVQKPPICAHSNNFVLIGKLR